MPTEHQFLKFILPAKAFTAMKMGTKAWLAECSCGHRRDVWESGGLNYMVEGEPRQRGYCPYCGEVTLHKIRKKTEAEKREFL